MTQILQTDSGETVDMQHQSTLKFYSGLENNFVVLPDGRTVVGPDGSNFKKLVMEDTESSRVSHIATHANYINTLLYHADTGSLLVGDCGGHIVHYQRSETAGSFAKVKDYGHVGIGYVYSSTQMGVFGIFGGFNDSSIVVVDLSEQKLVRGKVKTAFRKLDSLRACRVSEKKVFLSVGGRDVSYSGGATDIFELKLDEKDIQQVRSKVDETSKSEKTHFQMELVPESIMESFLRSIHDYVRGLFRHFSAVYAKQPSSRGEESQYFLLKASRTETVCPHDLTSKLASILQEFEQENLRTLLFFY